MPDQSISPSEVGALKGAVIDMDCLSQQGLTEISSIAKLALARMETPEGYRNMDDIANALIAIWVKANDIENCISSTAEGVGCNYIDEDARRRADAWRQACKECQSW